MSQPSKTKRGLTLVWSIGLGILLLGLTGVALMPATKSARIRFDTPANESSGNDAPTDEDSNQPPKENIQDTNARTEPSL